MFKSFLDYQKDIQDTAKGEKVTASKEPEYEYEMIDGNWTTKPIGYCLNHKGYLTENMARIHRCKKKQCASFRSMQDYDSYLAKKNKNRYNIHQINTPRGG